jgi:hypothetical protein
MLKLRDYCFAGTFGNDFEAFTTGRIIFLKFYKFELTKSIYLDIFIYFLQIFKILTLDKFSYNY